MISKLIIATLVTIVFLNGCTVKNKDSLLTKTAKYTVNTPVFVIAGAGMAATLLVQGTLIGGAKLLGVKPKKLEKDKK